MFRRATSALGFILVRARRFSVALWLQLGSRIRSLLKFARHASAYLHETLPYLFVSSYGGAKILKTRFSLFGYVLVLASAVAATFFLDNNAQLRLVLHPHSGTEIVIGAVSIMFALLVPLSIALIEDANKEPLARQVILKAVLRASFIPVVLLVVFIHLIVPQGWLVYGHSITLKTITAIPVLLVLVLIMGSFYRAYKWLVDGAPNPTGMEGPTDYTKAIAPSPPSYKFALIIKTLASDRTSIRWRMIWQRSFSIDYEEAILSAFFVRMISKLEKLNRRNAATISREMLDFWVNMDKRNLTHWYYPGTYLEQFLLVLAELINRTPNAGDSGLYTSVRMAQTNLERISKQIISLNIVGEDLMLVFDALGVYVESNDYFGSKSRTGGFLHDRMVSYVFGLLFDNLYLGHIDPTEFYGTDVFERWGVTIQKLTAKQSKLTRIVFDTFSRWLKDRLTNIEGSNVYRIGDIIELLFTKSDPITLSDLLWFCHINSNVSDVHVAVRNYLSLPRPFGFSGRTYESSYASEAQQLAEYKTRNQLAIDEAASLVALTFGGFFTVQLPIQDLLAETAILYGGFDDADEKNAKLNALHRRLEVLALKFKA